MADPKIPVSLSKVTIAKTFDKKLNTTASDALTAEIEAAIKKSGKLKLGSASGKDKGFEVTIKIVELAMNAEKEELSGNIELLLLTLPGPNLIGKASGKSKFQGIDPKKLDKEVSDLIVEIMKKVGPSLKKGLEDKIDSL